MSLFTSATSGVDPQTGSYLSKEQRVAMFQASRGRGGGGSSTPTGGKRGGVAPQNAIVVANKMAAVVQTLQTNTQETVQAVNVKVQENAQNIQDLYSSVQRNREAEAKEEKSETKLLRGERESALRSGKEKLIEGMSSAVAGLAKVGKKAADAAMAPVMGFWEKIKRFLLLLAAAWVIENLPEIIKSVKEFTNWVGDFKNWLPKSLTSLRGVWSIADNILGKMWRGFSRILGSIFRLATWIGRQTFRLLRKIFEPIVNFIGKLVKTLVEKISDVLGKAMRGAQEMFSNLNPLKGGGGATPPASTASEIVPPGGGTKALTGAAEEGGGNLFQRALRGIGDIGKKAFTKGGEVLEGGGKALQSGLGKMQEGMTGIKPQSAAKRMGWFEDAIAPLIKAFPQMKGALKGLNGLAKGALRAIPGIGFAIDLALNKGVAGQDWTEAIIRALGSSIAGGLSAAVGAQVGAGVGGTIGSAFLGFGAIPGAAIGAALGAIIAGIAGGYAGDQAGAFAYEGITGETRSENKPQGNLNVDIQASTSTEQGSLHTPGGKENIQVQVKGTDDLVKSATDGSSTPSGMTEPEGSSSSTAVVDLPPKVIDSGSGDNTGKVEIPTMVDDVPFWATADPAADMYRNFARSEFELAY